MPKSALSYAQLFDLKALVRAEFASKKLSDAAFAKHASATLGHPVTGAQVLHARKQFGINPTNERRDIGGNAQERAERIDALEARVRTLEQMFAGHLQPKDAALTYNDLYVAIVDLALRHGHAGREAVKTTLASVARLNNVPQTYIPGAATTEVGEYRHILESFKGHPTTWATIKAELARIDAVLSNASHERSTQEGRG